jgi:hypothetical protein
MAYQVLDNSNFNSFVAGQYDGTGPIATELQTYFAGVSSVSVNTTLDLTANVNILTPVSVTGDVEIAVPTTSGEALQLVVDHGPFPLSEDFDVSGTGSIAAFLTAPQVDFSLTGSGNDTVIAGGGNDTIDAGGGSEATSTATGNLDVFTGSGDENVAGGNGNDTFNINFVPGFDMGTTNFIQIQAGNSGNNVANFNDHASDATISTVAGVTTVDFTSGTNNGQEVTLQNVQTVNFLP